MSKFNVHNCTENMLKG